MKKVSCPIHGRLQPQVLVPDLPYGFQRDGAFDRLVYSGIDMPEGIPLYGQPLLHRPVVNRPQPPHVKGGTVGADAFRFQMALVLHHQCGFYPVKRDVAAFRQKTSETVQNSGVPLGRTFPACTFQFRGQAPGKTHEAAGFRRDTVLSHHLVRRVMPACAVQQCDDFPKEGHVIRNLLFQRLQVSLTPTVPV